MQVELELVDVARDKAGGHNSYRCVVYVFLALLMIVSI
jgi:hypothetical protein